jgi:hypothetical protein
MTANWQENRANGHVRLVLCSLLVLFGVVFSLAVRDRMLMEPDLWWHIKTGEWIWKHGEVPTVDPFSHSFAGEPWIAKEWLSQILFFSVFSAAGWNGVMLLVLAAMALAAGVLYWALSRDLKPIHAAAVCILALMLASPSFTVRPHLLTLVPFVIWTHQLFAASRNHSAPHFGWLLIILLWANLHAAFTIGFLLAFFAFLDFLERTRFSNRDMLLKWILFLALCPLVTLIHPYSWQAVLATLTVVGNNEAMPLITEWRPFNAQADIVPHVALLGLIFLAIVSGFRLGIARSLLVVLLLHLFLTHVRYAYYLFPVLAIVVAPEIARQFPRLSAENWRMQPRDPVERAMSRFFVPLVASISGALILLSALQAFALSAAPKEQVAITRAIAFAKSNGMTRNVMNHYNFGGQLIFNDIKTFIDGRADQLFLGGFTRKFGSGPHSQDELADAFRQYDIGWTLFPPKDGRAALLDGMAGWRRVYSDEFTVIHRRSEAQ